MRPAYRGGSCLLVLALAPLAALAAAVVAASFLSGARHASPARPAAQGSPVQASPRQAASPGSGTRDRKAALPGLRWASYHGVELPSSPKAGPRDTAGGLASGYAHTPLGALLAAVNIGVRANAQWGPDVFGPTIRTQVTGPDAAALLAGCEAAYGPAARAAHIAGGKPLGSAYVTEEAFRWVAYTPSQATVDVVSAGPGSQGLTARAVTRIQVTWDGTDWKVIAPLGGDWASAAAVLTSLSGYTVFPGQG
jgi:hypothetical protein